LGTSLLSACCMGWFRWELLCCYWLRIDCKYIVVVGRVFLQYSGSLFHEFRCRLLFFCRLHGVINVQWRIIGLHCFAAYKMWHVVSHQYSVVCLSVCVLVTATYSTKTAEPVEVPIGVWNRVGPRNHVLDGGLDLPRGRGSFRGISMPILQCKEHRAYDQCSQPYLAGGSSNAVNTATTCFCLKTLFSAWSTHF